MTPRRNPGAFALVEILFCLAITGMALTMTARLITTSVNLAHSVPRMSNALDVRDQWLGVLRQDVWATRAAPAVAGGRLELGDAVVWDFAGGKLRRTSGKTVRTWPVDRPVTWKVEGALVLLTDGKSEIPLPSHAVSEGKQ